MILRVLPALCLVVGAALALGASCDRRRAAGASTLDDAALCAHLAALGCSTGTDSACVAALGRLRLLEPVPPQCSTADASLADLTACGMCR